MKALEKEKKRVYKEGKIEGKREVAKVMLSRGMDISFVSEITGLSEPEILKLQSEMN